MTMRRALLVPICALAAQNAFAECKHTAPRSADIDAAGARRLVVESAAGDVVVLGESGATRVRVTGDACSNSAEALERIQIDARREGDTVYVTAVMPRERKFVHHTALDMKLMVPVDIALELKDSSGDIEVRAVASARILDSSGDQTIRDIAGDVDIDDSSGDIDVANVRGNVVVRDSSGGVRIADVVGNVTIPVDSSGDLSLRRIRGDVHIESDSSGDIVLAEINQNVRIDHDSSGDIRASDIGGDLTIASHGAGSISHRNVLGRVSLPRD